MLAVDSLIQGRGTMVWAVVERGALQLPLSVIPVQYPLEAWNVMFLSLLTTLRHCFNVCVHLARHFTFTCFTWLRRKLVPGRTKMTMCTNAPKWLQDCMHSVELKWHTNKHVQGSVGKLYSRLVSLQNWYRTYKPARLPFIGFSVFTGGQFGCEG